MAGFNAWDHVGSMINRAAEQSLRSGNGVYLPSLDDVNAALALVDQAWELLTPEL